MRLPEQLETVGELVGALAGHEDEPVYATTPHGTFLFTVERVQKGVSYGNEEVTFIRLVEVTKDGRGDPPS